MPGLVLIGLALGIGSAAYNTASNILFITLSLLLACLILSGVMSWLNLRGVCWRLLLQPPAARGPGDAGDARAVEPQEAAADLRPLVRAHGAPGGGGTAARRRRPSGRRPLKSAAAFARVEQATARGQPALRERLDPRRRDAARLALHARNAAAWSGWNWRASVRCFRSAFCARATAPRLRREIIVWPAPVEYRLHADRGAPRGRRRANAWRGPARATICWPCGATRRAIRTG